MTSVVRLLLIILAAPLFQAIVRLPRSTANHPRRTQTWKAIEAVLERLSQPRCSVIILTTRNISAISVSEMGPLLAPWGAAMFEAQDADLTQAQSSRLLDDVRRNLDEINDRKRIPLFPQRPPLLVTTEVFPTQRAVMVVDPESPGGERLTFIGPMANVIDYISRRMNFTCIKKVKLCLALNPLNEKFDYKLDVYQNEMTPKVDDSSVYTYVRSPDREWGIKKADGSWSGMVGMVTRESKLTMCHSVVLTLEHKQEVDIALGPISTTATRAQVVDFTSPLWITSCFILGRRGRPEVEPWGFLLPLAPLGYGYSRKRLVRTLDVDICSELYNMSSNAKDDFNHLASFLEKHLGNLIHRVQNA
ncbi:uncharacterized protein [Panulirus ornatus]|uniref:uncharacterized protein n=1 Tax=Panulirus ornatus TaxID=150431 RepID=UPI003A868F81